MKFSVPGEVLTALHTLNDAGFEAYIVGGCVRDLLLGKEPKDWYITTNAKPEEIQKLFSESVYENTFGTVGVKTGSENPRLAIVEITTYRKEEKYSDKRHPDKLEFTDSIEEDLKRRDFTINAIAMKLTSYQLPLETARGKQATSYKLIDPFGGQGDLEKKLVRTVGNPENRFSEDALRLLRAPRFATALGFSTEEETARAIKANASWLAAISKERIRDEFVHIIMAEQAAEGIWLLEELRLLEHIIPELREGIGVGQNKHHVYTVFEHNLKSLAYAALNDFSLDVRLASLLHDVGKPRTKRGEGPDCTFYGHQVVGERMALEVFDRLRFSRKTVERVALLIREHMFVYDVGTVTPAGVRRLIRRVSMENIDDLFQLREADRIGSGVPKAQPYRLRHLKFMVEKVSRDPISVKMLAVRGDDVMKILNIEPGPKIGLILNALLGEALENPNINTKTILSKRVAELGTMSDDDLKKLAEKGLGTKEGLETEAEEEIKKKHYVK